MSLEPGRQLLHYRLLDKIGEGGMGVVWKATDTTLLPAFLAIVTCLPAANQVSPAYP